MAKAKSAVPEGHHTVTPQLTLDNAVEAIGGEPLVLAKAGTHESPLGEVVGIASEHDAVAGTERGPNTIFRFMLDGTTVAHFGDFGQPRLRPEQWEALGDVDVLILPVGGGPTIAQDAAVELVGDLRPRLVVPMHYKTPAIGFLDPPDAFLDALGARVERHGMRVAGTRDIRVGIQIQLGQVAACRLHLGRHRDLVSRAVFLKRNDVLGLGHPLPLHLVLEIVRRHLLQDLGPFVARDIGEVGVARIVHLLENARGFEHGLRTLHRVEALLDQEIEIELGDLRDLVGRARERVECIGLGLEPAEVVDLLVDGDADERRWLGAPR